MGVCINDQKSFSTGVAVALTKYGILCRKNQISLKITLAPNSSAISFFISGDRSRVNLAKVGAQRGRTVCYVYVGSQLETNLVVRGPALQQILVPSVRPLVIYEYRNNVQNVTTINCFPPTLQQSITLIGSDRNTPPSIDDWRLTCFHNAQRIFHHIGDKATKARVGRWHSDGLRL